MRICERFPNMYKLSVCLPTILKFQLHMIARMDNTAHVKISDVHVHSKFEFALTVRLRWTKIFLEERDAPEKIILGAMDSDYCLVVTLSIYIQYFFKFTNAAQSQYLLCDTDEDPFSVKSQVSNLLHRRYCHLMNG
jgi:hypothetical protein